jgi:hypothetical protein
LALTRWESFSRQAPPEFATFVFALVLPVSLLSHLSRDSVVPQTPDGAGLAPPPADRAARRAALFRETPAETIQRVMLGTAWSLQPERIDRLVPLAKLCMRHLLEPNDTLIRRARPSWLASPTISPSPS